MSVQYVSRIFLSVNLMHAAAVVSTGCLLALVAYVAWKVFVLEKKSAALEDGHAAYSMACDYRARGDGRQHVYFQLGKARGHARSAYEVAMEAFVRGNSCEHLFREAASLGSKEALRRLSKLTKA